MADNILVLRKQNKTYNEIKRELGCSKGTISSVCIKAGLAKALNSNNIRAVLTQTEINEANKLYLEGNTISIISKKLKRSRGTLRKYIINYKHIKSGITNSQSVINWRKRKKLELIEYKGGKCEICGYNKCVAALSFHHINPIEKEFTISSYTGSFEKLKEEIKKCSLLCQNCHIEVHQGLHKNWECS